MHKGHIVYFVPFLVQLSVLAVIFLILLLIQQRLKLNEIFLSSFPWAVPTYKPAFSH